MSESAIRTNTAVAITGMGLISSSGVGVESFQNDLINGISHVKQITTYPLSFPIVAAHVPSLTFKEWSGFYPDDSNEIMTSINTLTHKALFPIQIALFSAYEAWRQAKLHQDSLDPERISLVVAAQNSSLNYTYGLREKFQNNPDYLNPRYALQFMDTNYIGTLSEAFNIRGTGFTLGAASASGNIALLQGSELIKHGTSEICMVVGAMADLSPMELQAFYNVGALGGASYADNPTHASRPFDKKHEGFVYGQASAAIVLESIESATARNATILGYLRGGKMIMDANHSTTPNINGELRAMQQALAATHIDIQDLDYINAHGTSSIIGDEAEAEAIQNLLSDQIQNVYVNSTKSITGHCLWSAGIVEAIATIIQMNEHFVHPTLNLNSPISDTINFVGERSKSHHLRNAISNSFGFGGINSTLVFSKEPSLR